MQILASKFIYLKDLENLEEVLIIFRDMPIQLSFFQKQDFLQLNHKYTKDICKSFNIAISTVHAPTVDVFDYDFIDIIETIKNIYEVSLISIHPQKGDCALALTKLQGYADILKDLNIILAYENFPSSIGKRKWISLPKEMYMKFDIPFLKLTFDTSHLDDPENCIEEFDAVYDKVAVVHLSDNDGKSQHQPLGKGKVPYKQFIKYLKDIDFQGPVVIEYMPEYENRLIDDVKNLIAD